MNAPTLLSRCPSLVGGWVELHYDGRFWMERHFESGTDTTVEAVEIASVALAHEHYAYQVANGEALRSFPGKVRAS